VCCCRCGSRQLGGKRLHLMMQVINPKDAAENVADKVKDALPNIQTNESTADKVKDVRSMPGVEDA